MPPTVQRTQFGSWASAMTWAYHIARTGRIPTRVRKIDGRWMAWRIVAPHRFELDPATGTCLGCGGGPDPTSTTCVFVPERIKR